MNDLKLKKALLVGDLLTGRVFCAQLFGFDAGRSLPGHGFGRVLLAKRVLNNKSWPVWPALSSLGDHAAILLANRRERERSGQGQLLLEFDNQGPTVGCASVFGAMRSGLGPRGLAGLDFPIFSLAVGQCVRRLPPA
jgi:hypothetical protein